MNSVKERKEMKEKPLLFHAREIEKANKKNVVLRVRDTDGSIYNYVTSDPEWAMRYLNVIGGVSE